MTRPAVEAQAAPDDTPLPGEPTYDALVRSYERHLRAANLRPRTQRTYLDATTRLRIFLADSGRPLRIRSIAKEHIEAFLADQLEKNRPATAANRYRGLKAFFGWLEGEDEIEHGKNLMDRIAHPRVPVDPPPVISDDDHSRQMRARAELSMHTRLLQVTVRI
jgi:site-specific recombinase XerD